MSAADGGPAFPHSRLGSDCDGMTLRDYFAAKALAGMLAASENMSNNELARYAYDVADAMLKARERV